MATQTKPKPSQTLARLNRELKAKRITQLRIAERAERTPAHVCNVLAGRDDSAHILSVARQLLAEAS